VEETPRFSSAQIHQWDSRPIGQGDRQLTLNRPIYDSEECPWERVYGIPSAARLEPERAYRISGWIRNPETHIRIFKFSFRTDSRGAPVAY